MGDGGGKGSEAVPRNDGCSWVSYSTRMFWFSLNFFFYHFIRLCNLITKEAESNYVYF